MSSIEFEKFLRKTWAGLSEDSYQRLITYRNLVIDENQTQNLTRLTSPREFVLGHLLDCIELKKTGLLRGRVMDFGSGVGIPGIPCAIVDGLEWVLAESEGKKAEFLQKVVSHLGLERVRVYSGRAEEFLANESVDSIVVRAVASVSKLYGLLKSCSTWNNLILLKGPKWDEEWTEFERQSRYRGKLKIESEFRYELPDPALDKAKQRIIVNLKRSTWNK